MNRDSRIIEIELDKIVPNRFQPRKIFNEDVSELAESIREHGVLQPITLRPLGEKYEIIMGERRFRACEKLGLKRIPAMIVEMNDREAMEVALIENLQRQNLTPIEEALSYKRILDAGYVTQEQLAVKLGKTQSTIANKLRLLSLDKDVQNALLKGEISERHARSILRLTDKEKQKIILKKIINDRLTVRKTDEEIRKMEREKIEPKASVEIIDFDDNPFQGNVAEPIELKEEPKVTFDEPLYSEDPQNVEPFIEEPIKYNEPEVSEPLYEEPIEESVNDYQPKPENNPKIPTIPISSIIDDTKDDPKEGMLEYNHSYTNNKYVEKYQNKAISYEKTNELNNQPKATFDEMVNSEPATNNLDAIKDVIEKCQNELKSLGYEVKLENFDFESMYQVIIKIIKK